MGHPDIISKVVTAGQAKNYTYDFGLPKLWNGEDTVHLHLEVKGFRDRLVLPLEDGAEERVTSRFTELRHLHLDRLWVELGRPQRG